ncbi:uncharacterized protein DS421_10g303010 [Arachis hypogaea]|nr:uncharacterized protein DS421_10g303010 [Arachis hypogaea]
MRRDQKYIKKIRLTKMMDPRRTAAGITTTNNLSRIKRILHIHGDIWLVATAV